MIFSQLLMSPLVTTRLLIALSSLTWALLLFYPGELFTVSRKTYSIMAMIAPEEVWGMLFAVHGVAAFWALNKCLDRRLTMILDASLGCLLWTTSTAACFAAHWTGNFFTYTPPAAMSGEVWIAVFSWWYLIRHWADLPEPTCSSNRKKGSS